MKRGFTLIEMLIGMALVIILISFGVGSQLRTVKMKKFQAAYDGLLADLQVARSNAISGKKNTDPTSPSYCGNNVLSWWIIQNTGSSSYRTDGVCGGVVTSFQTVSFLPITVSAFSVKFKPLGLGTDLGSSGLVITLSLTGFTNKTITVDSSGEIHAQ